MHAGTAKNSTVLTLTFIFCVCPVASGQVIDYQNFMDLSAFTLNGQVGTIHAGGPIESNGHYVLRLTDCNTGSSASSAFLTDPVTLPVDGTFSCAFSFQIPCGDADGFVFVIQTEGVDAIGGSGGSMGYGGTGGIEPSLGIELDIWWNGNGPEGGSVIEPTHIGIDLNGNLASETLIGITPNLDDGDIWYVWVDYGGSTGTLEVRMSLSPDRPTNPILIHNTDLITLLGSREVWLGFTGGTGGVNSDQEIRSWTFSAGGPFVRGDCNPDGQYELSDALFGLESLFITLEPLPCEDACDANDDGSVNISDMIYILADLFSTGAPPPVPYPACDSDPTEDAMVCGFYGNCP